MNSPPVIFLIYGWIQLICENAGEGWRIFTILTKCILLLHYSYSITSIILFLNVSVMVRLQSLSFVVPL